MMLTKELLHIASELIEQTSRRILDVLSRAHADLSRELDAERRQNAASATST